MLSVPSRIAIALIAGTEAYALSAFVFMQEALAWGLAVGLGTGAFLLAAPALPLARCWKFLRLRDILVPLIFFGLTVMQKPQLLPQNALRLAFALILFGGVGAAIRIALRAKHQPENPPAPQKENGA